MNTSQLGSVAPDICRELGVEAAWPDGMAARRAPDRDATLVAITMPRIVEEVELSGRTVAHGAETIIDHFVAGRERLFAKVHAHIAEHENTRVRQLENALDEALKLIYSRILSYGPAEYDEVARLRTIQRGAL